jgi:Microsomal signal peptidase 25 kDa subunit (SPC25)
LSIQCLEDAGYAENVTVTNIKILAGSLAVALSIYSHFNGYEYPENRLLIIGCIAGYGVCVGLVTILSWLQEGNAFFVGYLDRKAEWDTRASSLEPKIWVHSTLGPKGSSIYTIEFRRKVRSKALTDCVKLGKPYEHYFSDDGELATAVFRRDVKHLVEILGTGGSSKNARKVD